MYTRVNEKVEAFKTFCRWTAIIGVIGYMIWVAWMMAGVLAP